VEANSSARTPRVDVRVFEEEAEGSQRSSTASRSSSSASSSRRSSVSRSRSSSVVRD
jgi:hypothetical protein